MSFINQHPNDYGCFFFYFFFNLTIDSYKILLVCNLTHYYYSLPSCLSYLYFTFVL